MNKLTSHFKLQMAVGSRRAVAVINLGPCFEQEAGLYVSGSSGDYGTTLLATGSRVELESFVAENRGSNIYG